MGDRNTIIDIIIAAYNTGHNDTVEGYQRDPAEFAGELLAEMWDATPKPRRDPLTDPRPGDVVRFRQSGSGDSHIVAEVSEVTEDGVIVLYVGTDEDEGMSPSGWADWSGFDVEVLHTADEVTP